MKKLNKAQTERAMKIAAQLDSAKEFGGIWEYDKADIRREKMIQALSKLGFSREQVVDAIHSFRKQEQGE
jgi:DNA-binding transcriptional MerR regulator